VTASTVITASAASKLLPEDSDPAWFDITAGVRTHTAAGGLVWAGTSQDTHRLLVDGVPVTPPGLQLREVLDVDGDTVVFTDPTEIHVFTWTPTGGCPAAAPTRGCSTPARPGAPWS